MPSLSNSNFTLIKLYFAGCYQILSPADQEGFNSKGSFITLNKRKRNILEKSDMGS
jgi:hypothetical protein